MMVVVLNIEMSEQAVRDDDTKWGIEKTRRGGECCDATRYKYTEVATGSATVIYWSKSGFRNPVNGKLRLFVVSVKDG